MLNARVNLIFYFLTLALSFFSRKIFLDTLGADFVGLTGTLQNLLGFLNLAELGIGSAIGYVLYKPLFDHDETKINEIISVFGYLYRWIGKIILIAGCILACFLPLIFPNTEFDLGLIFFAYFYTSITFNPLEVADNMKKQGGFIPGIRPGKATVDYLNSILGYVIFIGAAGLTIVAVIPFFFNGMFKANVSFGGTSLIIIVSVILETLKQIESMMLVRNYKGFLND